jgi:hypothetical protein
MTKIVGSALAALTLLFAVSRSFLHGHEEKPLFTLHGVDVQIKRQSLASLLSARFVRDHLLQQLASEDHDLNRHNALYSLWNGKAKILQPVVKSSKRQVHQDLASARRDVQSSSQLIEKARNITALAAHLKDYAETTGTKLAAEKAKASALKAKLQGAIEKLKSTGALDGPQLLQKARIAKLRGHKAKAKNLMHLALSQAVKVYSHQKKMDKLHRMVHQAQDEARELKEKQQSALQQADTLQQEAIELKQQAWSKVALATKMKHEALKQNSTTMALASQVTKIKSKAMNEKQEARSALHHSFFWKE